MIIPSPLITLDYNPVNDVLFVEWPDIQASHIAEVKHSLQDIISTIKFYDVKKLLIDSRKTAIAIDKHEYTKIVTEFTKELLNTRLQKVARLESNNKAREAQVKELLNDKFTIDFQNFSRKTEAINWLETV